jgi:hypothetical protein
MLRVPDSDTRTALRLTSDQIFQELAMHHHSHIMARDFKNRNLPGQTPEVIAEYSRMVASHNYAMLAITLCKVMEFHKAFRIYLPAGLRAELDTINSRIAQSRILEYRNKVVGHLFDRKTGKPLDVHTIVKYWEALVGNQTEEEFRRWWWSTIHEPELVSVAGVMVRIAGTRYER